MEIKIDFDAKKILDQFEDDLVDSLSKVGKEGVSESKVTGDYQNRTGNLRNAPGYAVTLNGSLKVLDVPTSGHPQAKEATESIIENSDLSGTSLILADGMYYASFVEKRGFKVLSDVALRVKQKLQRLADDRNG